MLSNRHRTASNARRARTRPPAPRRATVRADTVSRVHPHAPAMPTTTDLHPLTDREQNQHLYAYEQRVKSAFDAIVPTLKRVEAIQHKDGFEPMAHAIVQQSLGFELPSETLAEAMAGGFDKRKLFAWAMFETYQRFSDDFSAPTT